jgi:hypothetical protein
MHQILIRQRHQRLGVELQVLLKSICDETSNPNNVNFHVSTLDFFVEIQLRLDVIADFACIIPQNLGF